MEIGQREYMLRGGKVRIFTRAADRNGIWQCRIKLDQGIVRRSTKTTDLEDAKRVAEELYDELRYAAKHNQPLVKISFKELAERFVKAMKREVDERRLGQGRLTVIEGTLRRYLIPFFGKMLAADIKNETLQSFDEWRADYWTVGYGATRRKNNCKAKPAQKTLLIEQGILRQILRYGVEINVLKQLPFMKLKRSKTNRRSAFSVGEYRRLIG